MDVYVLDQSGSRVLYQNVRSTFPENVRATLDEYAQKLVKGQIAKSSVVEFVGDDTWIIKVPTDGRTKSYYLSLGHLETSAPSSFFETSAADRAGMQLYVEVNEGYNPLEGSDMLSYKPVDEYLGSLDSDAKRNSLTRVLSKIRAGDESPEYTHNQNSTRFFIETVEGLKIILQLR